MSYCPAGERTYSARDFLDIEPTTMNTLRHIGIVALLLFGAPAAYASCAANFCAVNLTHTTPDSAGTHLDLRFEYIDQDQPRAGRERVNVGAVPSHHDEVRTINRNLIATLDMNLNPDWALSLQAPLVARNHDHIHHHHGAQLADAWDIDALGDARLLVRRRLSQPPGTGLSAVAGMKLPTGDYDEANAEGQEAERTLQPGSGTTDAILGLHYETTNARMRRFAAMQAQWPLREREHYRPGAQYNIDLGLDYALSPSWKGLLQLNTQIKDNDRGTEAEPADTGGSFVWLSPGLSYAVGHTRQIYGYVQLPLYQRVNGIQLTADYALIVGLNTRF